MYLKKIDIQGFKSFADKISLEFNAGITSVVGPNGSGKSNIADAVRWVLGEQSARTLRGTKMEDIIFAGTEHRKPLGLAEVAITIDNEDKVLPVDFSEVTVARRVYRSGESEYFINKTQCRLKDIHELFLDTGIGKDGYSIIGQGRVDEILSSKSEERRQIFEEASGIMKYKLRKQEALKKLDDTTNNLMRINDIISELENQLEPLKQQSEAARRYLDLRESLKVLDINVYLDNIDKFRVRLDEYDQQYKTITDNIETENNKLNEITQENSKKSEHSKLLEEKLIKTKDEYYNLENSLERFNSQIKVNEEKIAGFIQNITRIDTEIGELGKKIDLMSHEEDAKNKKLSYLNRQNTDFSAKLAEFEQQMEALIALLDENERNIEKLKSGIMDKLDILSDKKTQVNNINTHIENIYKRESSIAGEINVLLLENDRENMKKEDLSENIYKAAEIIKHGKNRLAGLIKEKSELDVTLDEKRKYQNSVKTDIQLKASRQKMLSDMEKNLEGYNRSVKVILQECKQSPAFGEGIHGALAQLISVDGKYETAIEMTLGSALQNIVTTKEEDAKKAIEYLKNNKLGRATFLPVNSVKGKGFENNLAQDIQKHEGFCGIASQLVQYKSDYEGIILSLLGKVVVVENLDSGIKLARKFGYSFRIVTLDGDILSTSGSMTGGSAENRSHGILSRSREISELTNEILRLKKDEILVEKQISEIIHMIEEINTDKSKEEAIVRENELIKIRDESHLAQIEENIKKAIARIDMLKQEKNQLVRKEEETRKELSKYENELSQIEKDIDQTKKVISEHQEKHKEDQSVRDSLHSDITDYKISVNSISESIMTVQEALNKINEEKEDMKKSIARKNADKNKNNTEIKLLNEANIGLEVNIKKANEEKLGKTIEIDRITEERKIIDEELADVVDKIQAINKNIMLLREDFSRIEVKKARTESEMEAIQNRMWDEYELTYNNALELRRDIGGITQAQRKINELRSEIKELGPVNVAAIEEYIKTKERFEFMSTQRNDMEQAQSKLQKIIYEITSRMKTQFMEQFKLINENFNIVFRELFEGGRAELILTDKDNVLESGIEIEVQPPGKKLQNMMLLSGGERAFTAIALLFSILRLKPSPFCVLDEIEAALDDANVYRFAEYLKSYTKQTQFVVVTHRKGTMEASDTLYGVTMQEHGISKIISMVMPQKVS